jgi:hypothetical protein
MTPNVPPLFYLAAALFVVGRFLVRELRERKLVLSRIFLLPGVAGALALYLLVLTASLFPKTGMLLAGETCIALGVGSAVGLAVAHFTKVRLGEAAGTVYVLGSGITVAIWIAALALRWAVRFALPLGDRDASLSANAALIVMVAAALGMVRYRVLHEARLLRERGITTPVSAA